MVGTLEDAAVRRAQTFSTRAAARILAISPDRIRYWVKRSLVRPLTRGRQMRFGFNDLLVMRLAKELLPTRHHLDPIHRCLERVRGMFGPARPVTSLRLANYEGQIVVRDGNVIVEAMSGQILFDFEAPPAPGKVEERFGPARVRERFEEARRLAESDPLRALTLYSELLGREPGNFEAHIDLASAARTRGRPRRRAARICSAPRRSFPPTPTSTSAWACSTAAATSCRTRCGVFCARSNAIRSRSRRIATSPSCTNRWAASATRCAISAWSIV